jgi:ATP-dependent protease ClpP protease subunit
MFELLTAADKTEDERPLFKDFGDHRVGNIDIVGDVTEPELYEREFDILRSARKSDKVIITINTYGGNLDTAVHFIDAIRQCKGMVTARLVGNGFSAGSLIFLACPKKEVGAFGSLMLHRESGGFAGKGSDTEKQMDYQKKFMYELYTEVYGPYLTDVDLARLMDGVDLWFTPKETRELLNK